MEQEDKSINTNANSNVFTRKVRLLSKPRYFFGNVGSALLKALLWICDLILSMILSIWHFVKLIGIYCYKGVIIAYKFIKRKCHQFLYNDWSGRLSFVLFGVSSLAHGQIVNGILYLVFEIGYIALFVLYGVPSIGMLKTLGTIANSGTGGDGEFGQAGGGHNSILILIYGLLWVLSIIVFIYIWLRSINSGYNNYRIQNFKKFDNVINKNKEFSTKLDNDVTLAYSENIKKDVFKKLHKEEIDNFLGTLESSFEIEYSKYLIDNTISEAYLHCKEIKKQQLVIEKLNNKKDKLIEKCNVDLEQFLAKQDIKLSSKTAKLTSKYSSSEMTEKDINEAIEPEIIDFKEIQDGQLESFKGKQSSKLNKITSKIKKENHKLSEINKTYSPYAFTSETINNSKFGKFNVYHIKVANYETWKRFLSNYETFVDVFSSNIGHSSDKNAENANEKILIKERTLEKVAEINAKYDAFEVKRAEINSKIKELKEAHYEKVKELKSNKDLEMSQIYTLLEEEEVSYIHENTILMNSLNEFPSVKNAKAMRKEEIKEVTHAAKRDIKYLKTNYSEYEYCLQTLRDYMMINYKFTFKEATEFINYMGLKIGKEGEVVLKNGIDVAKEKLSKIEEEEQIYLESHEDKYEGKSKTFVQQIKSLFNEKFNITILALPLTGICLFTIVPLIFSVLVAFTNFEKGHIPPTDLFTWNGLTNFINLFNADPESDLAILPIAIGKTVVWTLCWALIATFSNYILGIIVALMINKQGIKLKKLWRTVFVLTIAIPQFISLMSIGILLKDTGALGTLWFNIFGSKLGFAENSDNNAILSKIIIILVNIWVGIPYTILSTTGILLNIPKDLYESAKVDGAGTVTQFVKITMPYILFVTGPYLITQFIGNINNFNVIYFLTGGGPAYPGSALAGLGYTDLLITFLYKLVTNQSNPQYGIASAVGIVIFIICSFISIVMYNKSGSVKEEDQFQ